MNFANKSAPGSKPTFGKKNEGPVKSTPEADNKVGNAKQETGKKSWNLQADQYDKQLLQEKILKEKYIKKVREDIEQQQKSLSLENGKSKKLEEIKKNLEDEKLSYSRKNDFDKKYEKIEKFIIESEDPKNRPTYEEWKQQKDELDELIKNLELLKLIAEKNKPKKF